MNAADRAAWMIESDAFASGRVRHGFFGRRGGESSGIYAGNNCGFGSADDAARVAANRNRCVAALGLEPLLPEGGHVGETWRAADASAIHYLVAAPDFSGLHRLEHVEIWAWHGGAPLRMLLLGPGGEIRRPVLGMDLAAGERPQVVVPPGWWQAAESLGEWTLVGCTMAPGFEFERFELAPEGWSPRAR